MIGPDLSVPLAKILIFARLSRAVIADRGIASLAWSQLPVAQPTGNLPAGTSLDPLRAAGDDRMTTNLDIRAFHVKSTS